MPRWSKDAAAAFARVRHRDPEQVYRLALALIVLAGAALRLHGLGSLPLNYDEGATLYFAHLPFADLWGKPARLETNPPLFYMVAHLMVRWFGDAAAVLRLASAVAGCLCIPVAAWIARRFGGRGAGLVAAALVASSAVNVVCSQDARAYSMLTLAAMVAIASVVRLAEPKVMQDNAARIVAWFAYVMASVAALYLHNTAILMVVALNGVAISYWFFERPGFFKRPWPMRFTACWGVANAAILALYAFWLPVAADQSVHALANFWLTVPTLTDLRYAVTAIYGQTYLSIAQPVPDLLFLLTGAAGIVAFRSRRMVVCLAIFVLAGVPAATWLVSQWRPLMNGKTLLWLVPLFLVAVALGSVRLRRFRLPFAVVLVALQLVACDRYFRTRWNEGFGDVAAVLRDRARDGDVLYLDDPAAAILLAYYGWPRDRLAVYGGPGSAWFRGFDGVAVKRPDVLGIAHGRRLWVLTRSSAAWHRGLAAQLRGGMIETLDRQFGDGLMRHLALRTLALSLWVPRPR